VDKYCFCGFNEYWLLLCHVSRDKHNYGKAIMDLDAIKSEYSSRKPKYEKLKNEVIYSLKEELTKVNIPYHMIDGRIKELDSVIAKTQRQYGEQELDDINNIVDICGVRIICLFLSDMKKIGGIIEGNFDIEDKDDKVLSRPEVEFGYMSVHYIGKLPTSFSGARYNVIKDLRFEIQVRTIAMHSWATISHYLDYKSPHSIPSELRKDFSALSALFYLADSHFELFFQKGLESKQIVEQKAEEAVGIADEEINLDTFSTYLKRKYPNREHASIELVSLVVEELIAADIQTIGELDEEMQRSQEAFRHYEEINPPSGEHLRYLDVGVVRISFKICNKKFRGKYRSGEFSGVRYKEFEKYLK
jgi:putative GTP pyrophosphokinase